MNVVSRDIEDFNRRLDAITSQINTIADHALGCEAYSYDTLREISQALHQAAARLEIEIKQRRRWAERAKAG